MAQSDNFQSKYYKSGEWIVNIVRRPWGMDAELWVARKIDDKTLVLNVSESGTLTETIVKEGEQPQKPFAIMPLELLQVFVDALTDKIPPTKKEVVEGILEATKFHLEDMRKLVFDPEKVVISEVRTNK